MNSSLFPAIKSTREAIGAENISNKSLYFDKYSLPNDYGKNNTKEHINGDKKKKKDIQKDEYLNVLSEIISVDIKKSDLHKIYCIKKEYGENAYIVCAKLKSNLALNLSTGIIDGTGVSLDRFTGLPIILSSAVKGVSRHAAYLSKDKYDDLDIEVFGNESTAKDALKGSVTFFSALSYSTKISKDILTSLKIDKGIIDSTPNKFLIVKAESVFVFSIALTKDIHFLNFTKEEILDRAKQSLFDAFELGFGAKTAAGFGAFEIDNHNTDILLRKLNSLTIAENELINQKKEAENKRFEELKKEEEKSKMPPEAKIKVELIEAFEDSNKFAEIAKNISSQDELFQQVFISLFSIDKGEKKFREKLKNWKKKAHILNPIKETAAKFGVNL